MSCTCAIPPCRPHSVGGVSPLGGLIRRSAATLPSTATRSTLAGLATVSVDASITATFTAAGLSPSRSGRTESPSPVPRRHPRPARGQRHGQPRSTALVRQPLLRCRCGS